MECKGRALKWSIFYHVGQETGFLLGEKVGVYIVIYTCNLSIQEGEAGGSGVRSSSCLEIEIKARLSYMGTCLKNVK